MTLIDEYLNDLLIVGASVGLSVGVRVGITVGLFVGDSVGACVESQIQKYLLRNLAPRPHYFQEQKLDTCP